MTFDVATMLTIPVFRAMDVDADGRVLAGTDETGSMQLIEIQPDGRVDALTALPGPCAGRYVPGRRTVLVTHDEGGNERSQISVLDAEAVAAAGLDDLEPLVHDSRYIHDVADVTAERVCYTTNRRNSIDFDVIIRDLGTGEETVAYDGGGSVRHARMSPDGRYVVVTLSSSPANSDQMLLVDLKELDVSSRVSAITDAGEHAQYADAHFNAGSDALVVTTDHDRDLTGIARYDIATRDWTWLVTDDSYDVTGWLAPDGSGLLVVANEDGASRVAIHDGDGRRLRDVALPAPGCVEGHPLPSPQWSPDGATIALSFCGVTVPGDVLRVDVASGAVTGLTDSAAPIASFALVEPQSIRIAAPDGEQIPCFVYPAAGPAAGAEAAGAESAGVAALHGSAVLYIHGGPEGQSRRIFSPIISGLALAGHTVLVPNVRGSVGYGKRWYSLDDVRLRLNSVADMAAIHAYLPELGLDQSRVALWGGSYGGYMVLAGLAFQPDLWAAGVDIVGISSLVTFLENTSAYRRAVREREYGSLEHDRDFLIEASPLTRIDDMAAPLFVIHGANDPRVPLSEAEQLHAALGAKGIPCELRVYGDEGHGLAKRANRLDAFPAAFEFLAKYLAAPTA
jgi:dipeptidyl aminopeptidase/acylaminoacyl peptidase